MINICDFHLLVDATEAPILYPRLNDIKLKS